MFIDGFRKIAAAAPGAPVAPGAAQLPKSTPLPAYKPPGPSTYKPPAKTPSTWSPPPKSNWNPSMKQFPRKAPMESQASVDATTNWEMGIR